VPEALLCAIWVLGVLNSTQNLGLLHLAFDAQLSLGGLGGTIVARSRRCPWGVRRGLISSAEVERSSSTGTGDKASDSTRSRTAWQRRKETRDHCHFSWSRLSWSDVEVFLLFFSLVEAPPVLFQLNKVMESLGTIRQETREEGERGEGEGRARARGARLKAVIGRDIAFFFGLGRAARKMTIQREDTGRIYRGPHRCIPPMTSRER